MVNFKDLWFKTDDKIRFLIIGCINAGISYLLYVLFVYLLGEKYYQVCAVLIRDVAEIFDCPRFMHLGYDEETDGHQRKYKYCVVRQGDRWWHDFLWFVKETEKTGMRPWIWSD